VAGIVGGLVYLALRFAWRGEVSLSGVRDQNLADPVPGIPGMDA